MDNFDNLLKKHLLHLKWICLDDIETWPGPSRRHCTG